MWFEPLGKAVQAVLPTVPPETNEDIQKKQLPFEKEAGYVENVPTLNSVLVDQFSKSSLVGTFGAERVAESFPKSVDETREFLKLFDQYRSERLTETVWELSGIPKDVLMANSYLTTSLHKMKKTNRLTACH